MWLLRNLNQELSLYSDKGCRHPSWQLNCQTKCPHFSVLKDSLLHVKFLTCSMFFFFQQFKSIFWLPRLLNRALMKSYWGSPICDKSLLSWNFLGPLDLLAVGLYHILVWVFLRSSYLEIVELLECLYVYIYVFYQVFKIITLSSLLHSSGIPKMHKTSWGPMGSFVCLFYSSVFLIGAPQAPEKARRKHKWCKTLQEECLLQQHIY